MKHARQRAGWVGRSFALTTGSMVILWGTGLVLVGFPASDLMELSEPEAMLRHASGLLHGVMAWALCVMVGRGVWPHVRLMLGRKSDRWQWSWGWVNLVVLGLLGVSGLLLLYGRAAWHEATVPLHVWLGVSWAVPWVVHARRRGASTRAGNTGSSLPG